MRAGGVAETYDREIQSLNFPHLTVKIDWWPRLTIIFCRHSSGEKQLSIDTEAHQTKMNTVVIDLMTV